MPVLILLGHTRVDALMATGRDRMDDVKVCCNIKQDTQEIIIRFRITIRYFVVIGVYIPYRIRLLGISETYGCSQREMSLEN